MNRSSTTVFGWVLAGALALSSAACGSHPAGSGPAPLELLNVSYDPTRELWKEINDKFAAAYQAETGTPLTIKASHAGSSTQARAVIDGLEADVVTLALWSDTNAIAKKGLIEAGWKSRFPNRSLPYYSTIVFVVRKGNPKGIKDWPDIVADGVQIITPNPKTSGNGRLSFLAAWGSVVSRGGSDKEAGEFVTKLYRQTPVLDSGARGATTTFSQKKIGDVHLTWENEAHLEVAEAKGELELIYPPISIRAEPHVAVVDANVKQKGTEKAAVAYLNFLYTPEGQEIIGKHNYRPNDAAILEKFSDKLPEIKLFAITDIAQGWDDAQERFLAEGAMFDQIFSKR